MVMTRVLLGTALLTVFACGLRVILVAAISTMPPVTAMSSVAKHVHCDHRDAEQNPNPVLRKPFHNLRISRNVTGGFA